jgi:hypothetical protein
MKVKEDDYMELSLQEEICDVAVELNKIYKVSPEHYYYIKGFIHALLQKSRPSNPAEVMKDE